MGYARRLKKMMTKDPEVASLGLRNFPLERGQPTDLSPVEARTSAPLAGRSASVWTVQPTKLEGQRSAAADFQAQVSEVQQEAETRLTAFVERIRKELAEQHEAELARLADRHAKELQQARAICDAEVSAANEQVRQIQGARQRNG